MKRARLEDIARHTGLGIAAVDRVLNGRGGVRPETARRVLEAARLLGASRVLPAPWRRLLRFDVVLVQSDSSFFRSLGQAFRTEAAAAGYPVSLHLTFLDKSDRAGLVRCIDAAAAVSQGLALVAEDDPDICMAIARAAKKQLPVVTLVTDLPGSVRIAYIGIDNFAAGRAAGWFISRTSSARGDVLVVCGDPAYSGHAERLAGFRSALATYAPGLTLREVLIGHDDPAITHERLRSVLPSYPALAGFYNTGGAVAAAAEALGAAGLDTTIHVAHEMTPTNAALLRAGRLHLAIDQNPALQARRALSWLQAACGLSAPPTDMAVPFSLHGPENIR